MNKYNIDWNKVYYKSITISTRDGVPLQWTLNVPSGMGSVEVGSRFARSVDEVDLEMRALEQKVDQSGYREAKEILRKF
jgi:hypothetical protein